MKSPVLTKLSLLWFLLLVTLLLSIRTATTFVSTFQVIPQHDHLDVTRITTRAKQYNNPVFVVMARRRRHFGSSASTTTALNMIGRIFRRNNKTRGVKTLERSKEDTKKQQLKKKEPMYRVMMYATEIQPEIVARIVAQVIPSLNRMVAYELCLMAKATPSQKVLLVLINQKQAELYCLRLRKRGLPVSIELHDDE